MSAGTGTFAWPPEQTTLADDLHRTWTPEQASMMVGVEWGRGEQVENQPSGAWCVWNDAFQEAEKLGLVEVRHCQRMLDGTVEYYSDAEADAFWSLPLPQRKKHPRRKVIQAQEGCASWCEWRRVK